MASRDLYPQEILQVVLDKSCAKAQSSVSTLAVLSVLAGGYIGFGYLAYLKVVSAFRTNGAAWRLCSARQCSPSP